MTVPKLRFKEFDGDWSETSIGQLTKYFKGYAFKSESYKESGRRIIRVSDLGRDSIKYDNDAIFLDVVESSNYKDWMLKKDDIVITTVGSKPHLIDSAVGRPIYIRNNEEGLLNQNLLVLRPINQEVEPYFIFSQLLDNKYLTHIETIQRGNANQSNITVKDLQEFKVFSTSKIEQTKIASFLSAVDEKISQLTQKHALLSRYKQGMMQKLFSQQIRFKTDHGSEFGDWEETLLSEFLTESLIKGLKGNEAKKLTVKLWGKGVVPKNEAFEGSENTQYYKRFVGQLIYGKLDFLNCAFGIIPAHLDGYETTIDAPSFEINKEKANPYFLLNRFLQKDFYKKNGEEADGSRKAKRINQSVFLAMQIDLPCLEEQTKIANFLSSIDQKIEVVAQQIEQAKIWKKGLLQQMFV